MSLIPDFSLTIPFTDVTITESGVEVGTPVGTVTTDYTGQINLPYGQTTTVGEILSEAEPSDFVAPFSDLAETVTGDLSDLATTPYTGTGSQSIDLSGIGDIVESVNPFTGWFSDPSTSPLTPYAEAYVDWYQTGTPVERAVDVIFEAGSGTGQEIEDIITGGLEQVPPIVESLGTAGATIIEPIAEPTGDFLESLILPATLLGGAYILLK
jgi:hypothetical protein